MAARRAASGAARADAAPLRPGRVAGRGEMRVDRSIRGGTLLVWWPNGSEK